MNTENPEALREIARSGIDFSKCQSKAIVEAYNNGRQVEFEAFSPYVADYDLKNGDIRTSPLLNSDATGIAIAKKLRAEFPQATMVSLYDEYNTGMPDSTDIYGNPRALGPQLELDEPVKKNFRQSVEQLLRKHQVLKEQDREGENFLLISESSKIQAAENLVAQLESAGHIRRSGEAIYYINKEAENPAYVEVQLRTKQGRWLCEALDAASYLDPKILKPLILLSFLINLDNNRTRSGKS